MAFEFVQEPQTSLSKRERRGLIIFEALDGRECGVLVCDGFDGCGEGSYGGMQEELIEGQIDVKGVADAVDCAGGEQAVATEVEEIIRCADVALFKDFGENGGEFLLNRALGLDVLGGAKVRSGQGFAIYLAVGCHG